jgi:8-oxo-dGTP diphosphatase
VSEKPYRLAVRAVIRDERGRCLLVRRSATCRRFVGTWEWPGGKVDDGEAFDAALRREVREETGLDVELGGVLGAIGFEMDVAHIAMLCLAATVTGGRLVLSDEHDEHAWVPIAELPRWDLTDGLDELARTLAAKECGGVGPA